MKCAICDSNDWENIDHLRLKKANMCMCKKCGFISYPSAYKTEAEIKEYYRANYRKAPQYDAIVSGSRKLYYHSFFLEELLSGWREHGIESPVVCDVGAALGMFVNWMKSHFPKGDITGTELDLNYRKVAYYHYGIKLEEDIDTNKKYDMISCYHTIEHMMEPDLKLKQFASLLKDNGVIYLAAPIWFREMNIDLEYMYAEPHINSWGEEHLEWLIKKSGLEIVYKNDDIYGNTYILKKSTAPVTEPVWDMGKYKKIAEDMFKAWCFVQEQRSDLAIETYKNFPHAWISHYEFNRQKFHKDAAGLDAFLKQMIEACPNSCEALNFAADIYTRYEKYQESYDLFSRALKKKPNNPNILIGAANTYRMRALKETDQSLKIELVKKCLDILHHVRVSFPDMEGQVTSWMFNDYTKLEMGKGGITNGKKSSEKTKTKEEEIVLV